MRNSVSHTAWAGADRIAARDSCAKTFPPAAARSRLSKMSPRYPRLLFPNPKWRPIFSERSRTPSKRTSCGAPLASRRAEIRPGSGAPSPCRSSATNPSASSPAYPWARPNPTACLPFMGDAVSPKNLAAAGPMRLGRNQVAPFPGTRPTLTSGTWIRVVASVIMKSAEAASPRADPAHRPRTTLTVGMRRPRILSHTVF